MKVTGEHAFSASREQVWAALQDPQMLADSLPGLKQLQLTGPDAYTITVSVGVGSVKGVYDGTFELADKVDCEACRVLARASGGPGSVDATAHMRMRDAEGGGALLTYEADANLTGPLAGVGQRLVGSAARRTTRDFLDALDRRIAAPAGPATAAAAPAEAVPAAAAGAPSPAPGATFAPSPAVAAERAARAGVDPVVVAVSMLSGFLLALIGIAIGRRTAR
jgi:carbon monoxide dehydrogenase subunit G